MNKYDINSLNEEQKKVLFETDGVILVSAGAGSGKTRLLTHRICYLIENNVDIKNILAITFTNKAANEIKSRLVEMMNLPISTLTGVWISTIHSMCVRILRKHISYLDGYDNNFTIVDENDRKSILKKLMKEVNMPEEDYELVDSHIENIKNKGLDIDDYFSSIQEVYNRHGLKDIKKICLEYEDYLMKNNSLDFDDLLNKTLFLFNNYPNVLEEYAERFKYILVDEFQDINTTQYKIIKLLASKHKNLFVVGDEDQCIYSWRGADIYNIFNLKKDFENVKEFKLERNYRSTKNILTMANNLIQNNDIRFNKMLWTEKPDGEKPVVYNAFDERDEALFVAKTVCDLAEKGVGYDDIAVLMRINALSRPIEDAFAMLNIPYKLYGGPKFYERAEVKIVLAYLSIFVNLKDEISLAKVINFPKRGIGDVSFSNLKTEAGDQLLINYLLSEKFKFSKYYSKLKDFVETYQKLKESIDKISIVEFVKKVIKSFKIDREYSGKDDDSINRARNLDSLILGVQEFESQNEDCTIADYLANVMLKSDIDGIQENGFVSVATIHAVKGLEFKVVFLIGLEEGILPISRALNSNSEMEEERRLMYVALTRAMEKIYLVYACKRFIYGKNNYEVESRFLKELGIVDKKKTNFSSSGNSSAPAKEEFKSVYEVGDKVYLPRFGEGVIKSISDDGYVGKIDFEDFGLKEIMLNSKNLEKVD